MTLAYTGGTSTSSELDWIVQVDNTAIFQMRGMLNAHPATLRMRVSDSGQSGRGDAFRVTINQYDSGTVQVASGNVRPHWSHRPWGAAATAAPSRISAALGDRSDDRSGRWHRTEQHA